MTFNELDFTHRLLVAACAWLAVSATLVVTLCALTRCRKCRGWHDSEGEERRCKGGDDGVV